jgi:hypothetical protein
MPVEMKGHNICISLGKIDDVDETFFNGKKVGGCGIFSPNFLSAFDKQRIYKVDQVNIKFGKTNTIAVKVFDASGGGGMNKIPMGMIEVK